MSEMNQLLLLILMMITDGKTLTRDQVDNIKKILLGSSVGMTEPPVSPALPSSSKSPELIYGLAGMAAFLGVSMPTVAKYRERYEPARIRFGGRKLVWDKAKVIEIAKECKR